MPPATGGRRKKLLKKVFSSFPRTPILLFPKLFNLSLSWTILFLPGTIAALLRRYNRKTINVLQCLNLYNPTEGNHLIRAVLAPHPFGAQSLRACVHFTSCEMSPRDPRASPWPPEAYTTPSPPTAVWSGKNQSTPQVGSCSQKQRGREPKARHNRFPNCMSR